MANDISYDNESIPRPKAPTTLRELVSDQRQNGELHEESQRLQAKLVYAHFDQLVKSGFTREEAYQLVLTRGLG